MVLLFVHVYVSVTPHHCFVGREAPSFSLAVPFRIVSHVLCPRPASSRLLCRRHFCQVRRQRLPDISFSRLWSMKYIEFSELARLSQALTHEGPECSVHTRIEAYSCKNVNRDKKLFRALEHAYAEEAAHIPPSFAALDREADNTPFGPMDRHASRKTLYLLIATLNIAFPDHDFAGVKPAHFCKEVSGAGVLNALSTTLVTAGSNGSPTQRPGMPAPRTYSAYPPTSSDFFPSSLPTSSSPVNTMMQSPLAPPPIVTGTHPTLYRILDEVIGLADCEVYSYVPDIASDPHATDYSDDEDNEPAPGDDDESLSESDEEVFAFDDYDVDELRSPRRSARINIPSRKSSDTDSDGSPLRVRLRRRGALLWSSHWFFLNRKLKRILFISVCARTKGGHQWTSDEESYGSPEKLSSSERFVGWEGAAGAGARALNIGISGRA
ncbi:Maf1-domain-containing protein [Sanghuangporus baumii]|uniref:Maf1-domain-containing protein n=1 Tax=Sanghuangporus baumii TaxID=108892 RepID=A0A9Q5I2J7_SANBA|nr:Maf1-domain-containing protein [Sanghuangporus baumii]